MMAEPPASSSVLECELGWLRMAGAAGGGAAGLGDGVDAARLLPSSPSEHGKTPPYFRLALNQSWGLGFGSLLGKFAHFTFISWASTMCQAQGAQWSCSQAGFLSRKAGNARPPGWT